MTQLTCSHASVRVPCSTSNLGSGYDTIGLALDRFLRASFHPDDRGTLDLERTGTLAHLSDADGPDLVETTFRQVVEGAGAHPSGRLVLESSIPVGRGLGASAAAVLAGYDLGRAVIGRESDEDGAFDVALRHEGHGDNAAPSLFGGLRAVAQTADGPVVMGLTLHEGVGFAYAAPSAAVATSEARALLPRTVPHRTAASSLGRLVALLRGLAECNPELIRIGVKDELHVPFRLPLIPGALAAISAGTDAGAWAITVSGAGSGLIAMCDPSDAAAVAAAMHRVFDAGVGDPQCVGFALSPAMSGLVRESTA